jgi:hypothetical protein
MKMVRVYKDNDSILACAVDLEYYKSIGWSDEAPVKKAVKAKAEEGEA